MSFNHQRSFCSCSHQNEAITKHKLVPGLVLSCCEHRPDTKKSRKKSKKGGRTHPSVSGESPPKVDILRQKIDAAFFRENCAPKDKRPHWADQLVPVEIKTRKEGDIRDPFEDPKEGEEEEEEAEDDDEVDDGIDIEPDDADEEEEEYDLSEDVDDDDDTASSSNLEPKSSTRKAVRGQLASYADLLFTVQQRTEVFMLFVIGRRFRIIRWDRAGVIVTKSIDYFEDWGPLCNFFWRIAQLPDHKLGLDPTATRLSQSDPDWSMMDAFAIALESDVSSEPRDLRDEELQSEEQESEEQESEEQGMEEQGFVFDYVRQTFARSLADSRWPRYRLQVNHSRTTRYFLVGKPAVYTSGAIGRGTRGYVAIDLQTHRFVWLKDSWRAFYNEMEKEGTIVERLKNAGIAGVPTVICHGDVARQRTATSAWWERKNPRGVKRKFDDGDGISQTAAMDPAQTFRLDCPIRRHKHYRLVVQEVCMDLKKFKSGKQLAQIIYDCIKGEYTSAVLHKTFC